jgi:probable F420-dependent oxidoreductase
VQVGVLLPQTEIGNDPSAIREFAQATEDLGYAHIAFYEHVLGAERSGRPSWWRGVYDHTSAFYECFVLLGFLAAVTKRVGLVPAVLVLPQRQTALVAKQAAEVDVLSGGRLRLGVGLGWNHVEFEALGTNFRDRGRRIEEQMEVLRALWTKELLDYKGRWHRIDRAGLNPLPIQQPIPIWMGADAEVAVRRVARLADGWFPYLQPDPEGVARLERFREYVRDAGRDPARVGVEGRVYTRTSPDPERWAATAQAFRDLGVSHLQFTTLRSGYQTLEQHLAALRRFRETAPVFA